MTVILNLYRKAICQLPPTSIQIHISGWLRSCYSDRHRPIPNRLAENDDDLFSDLTELEGATNDRLLARAGATWDYRH